MLQTSIVLTALAVLLLMLGPAVADEASGKVQKLDRDQRMIVLEDGSQLWLAEGVSLDHLSEGQTVKVVYEEKDGKKWVTKVEVSH